MFLSIHLIPSQIFVSSYWAGLIELNNEEVTGIYNEDNSSLEELANVFNLVLFSEYDREGTLMDTNRASR